MEMQSAETLQKKNEVIEDWYVNLPWIHVHRMTFYERSLTLYRLRRNCTEQFMQRE